MDVMVVVYDEMCGFANNIITKVKSFCAKEKVHMSWKRRDWCLDAIEAASELTNVLVAHKKVLGAC
jgi:hypothetical protein